MCIRDRVSTQSTWGLVDGSKISSECATRKLLEDLRDRSMISHIYNSFFGVQSLTTNKEDNEFLERFKDCSDVKWLHDIRKTPLTSTEDEKEALHLHEPITEAGIAFTRFVHDITTKNANSFIHIAFSLDAINSGYCPGVSNPSVSGGLTSEEAVEIMFQAGKCPQVTSVDITEYNPAVEDFRTGRLVSNMFYYFSMGYTLRPKFTQSQLHKAYLLMYALMAY
eukprot:TRINITY_DN6191_c0_g1_i10.p1 TRINITY_DN6191_c0_g1~~TRINITY_DN6191_c0_g1_i10.p1  ORF type:complete len:223 (-),score=29.93 TRINITY_DN6191_c0_g1_i10:149-817(-)